VNMLWETCLEILKSLKNAGTMSTPKKKSIDKETSLP